MIESPKESSSPSTMTLEGILEDEGALEGIVETIEDMGHQDLKVD
jgi:hypothetical protein